MFEIEGKTIYHAGDTAPFAEMQWIGDDHDIDLAFLPIGDCFTMDAAGAVRATGLLKPDRVVPVHYDTFPYIEIDMDAARKTFAEAAVAFQPMQPGETLDL